MPGSPTGRGALLCARPLNCAGAGLGAGLSLPRGGAGPGAQLSEPGCGAPASSGNTEAAAGSCREHRAHCGGAGSQHGGHWLTLVYPNFSGARAPEQPPGSDRGVSGRAVVAAGGGGLCVPAALSCAVCCRPSRWSCGRWRCSRPTGTSPCSPPSCRTASCATAATTTASWCCCSSLGSSARWGGCRGLCLPWGRGGLGFVKSSR